MSCCHACSASAAAPTRHRSRAGIRSRPRSTRRRSPCWCSRWLRWRRADSAPAFRWRHRLVADRDRLGIDVERYESEAPEIHTVDIEPHRHALPGVDRCIDLVLPTVDYPRRGTLLVDRHDIADAVNGLGEVVLYHPPDLRDSAVCRHIGGRNL